MGTAAAKTSGVGVSPFSPDDLPEAIRSSGEDLPTPSPTPRRAGLRRRAASLLNTGVSIVAVMGLLVVAAGELGAVPRRSSTPLPEQSLGAAWDEPAAVVEIEPPTLSGTPERTFTGRTARPKSKGRRHVTLSFGAPAQSGQSASTSGSDGSHPPAPQPPEKEQRKKRSEKVQEVEAHIAQPTAELIHIHKIGTGEHFYSIDRAECERRYQDGYIYRGIVGLVFDRQVEGTVPLRTDDGIAAYIWRTDDEQDERLPVHYFRGPGPGEKRDYYTAREEDRQDYVERGWIYKGVVGYVTAR